MTSLLTSSAAAERRFAMTPLPYVVTHAHRENSAAVTLAMEPADPSAAPISWKPGQFTMLYAFGVGEIPVSISGYPGVGGPLVQTVRDVGAVSHAITELRAGQMLGVRGPFGRGWRDRSEPERDNILIVAGGLGLAPVRPLVYNAAARRAAYGTAEVIIGSRNPDELLYTDEYRAWREFGLNVIVTVDRADEDWDGEIGMVTQPLAELSLEPEHTTAYLCGPEVMMRATAAALTDHGFAPSAIRLSMERSMKCGVGVCGHCQLGPELICRDGPCYGYDEISGLMAVKEL